MIKVENLTKKYGYKTVLSKINLDIKEKEIVVIVGPSGRGKTTLIRCLCGIEEFEDGRIWINGKQVDKKRTDLYRDIGMVFQHFQLFDHRTVMQNLIDAPLYHKMDTRDNIVNKAKELMNDLGIENICDRYPMKLSGGQKQRVAIARACMLDPKVLCLDEPTSALDEGSQKQVIDIIKELNTKMTILVITHDESFARKLGGRIMMFD